MSTERSLTRPALGVLLVAAVVIGLYGLQRMRTASAATPPITVSPNQNVQQTVQVVVPGAPPGSVPSKPIALAGQAAPPVQSTRGTPVAAQGPPPVTLGDITFEARTCSREDEGVACNFLVTNAADETYLVVDTFSEMAGSTVAFDSRGESCKVRRAIFAGSSPGGLGVKARLSPTVPTPLVVIFQQTLAPAFDAITLGVRIPQGDRAGASRAVVFRHVKIDG
jgi:hypothetical protein